MVLSMTGSPCLVANAAGCSDEIHHHVSGIVGSVVVVAVWAPFNQRRVLGLTNLRNPLQQVSSAPRQAKEGDTALIEKEKFVERREHRGSWLVNGDDNAATRVANRAHRLHHSERVLRVEPTRWFVKEQQGRQSQHLRSQHQLALLPAADATASSRPDDDVCDGLKAKSRNALIDALEPLSHCHGDGKTQERRVDQILANRQAGAKSLSKLQHVPAPLGKVASCARTIHVVPIERYQAR
mmetsp:Transcript_6790/g.11438  ORF Transcript_6790/g.11438 Transcript_6790/m.11438 type:complete len:239 (+) Transcript_6790:254-970(+)